MSESPSGFRRFVWRAAIVAAAVGALAACVSVRPFATALLGEARVISVVLEPGTLRVPSDRGLRGYGPGDVPAVPDSGMVRVVVDEWASRELPDWQDEGKVTAPRVMLAKLSLGRDVESVNRYLQAAEPWAGIGSTWGLRPNGDYDFSLPPLTAILYLFGDRPDLLYPETRDHLVEVLLNQDGRGFTTTVPGSLGLVGETENHILMNEGSRYLKNQWLRNHGESDSEYDNVANGQESRLVDFIREIELAGPYEFNSNPYAGYTLMALLTLDGFADEPVSTAARALIDRINFEYALGSLGLRRYVPYRRQTSRAGITDLSNHAHTSMMRTWVALGSGIEYPVEYHTHQAVYAALMPYRLPAELVSLALASERDYYVRIGRGPKSSAEIYSAGDGYLLGAGGTGRRGRSQIVARPVTLMLADGAGDAGDLFSIGGSGDYRGWNNTGVLPGVAVARGPAEIPGGREPVAASGIWRVFTDDKTGVTVAVASTEPTENPVALLYVLDPEERRSVGMEPDELAAWLDAHSGSEVLLAGRVSLPDGRAFTFDLDAPADRWVISSVDGEVIESDLTLWPRLGGWIR